jgi:hypothetical protein
MTIFHKLRYGNDVETLVIDRILYDTDLRSFLPRDIADEYALAVAHLPTGYRVADLVKMLNDILLEYDGEEI